MNSPDIYETINIGTYLKTNANKKIVNAVVTLSFSMHSITHTLLKFKLYFKNTLVSTFFLLLVICKIGV